ncbi:MAG TPA: GAF domain-containing protein [Solirubrobacteraceae bacterium]|nr:GAF domain-containing protein [Solirubrobacteraceae bacterium]
MRPDRFLWRWRERILAGALALAAVLGFVLVRHATDNAAQRQAQQHADLVGLQVQSNAARAAAYADAIRGYIVSHRTVSEAGFSSFALGILGLADLNEAAWVQPVAEAERTRYETSVGRPITEPRGRQLVRASVRGLYYPATLITQVLTSDVPGVDLGAYPPLRRVLASSEALFAVVATAPVELPGGRTLFFVQAAPRAGRRGDVPGFVVVFVPLDWLEGSFADAPGGVEIRVGGGSVGAIQGGSGAITQSFTAAARRWSVLVPRGRPSATASALAWSVLGGGLALAALTLLLGAKRTQAEEDRRAQLWLLESLDRVNRAIQSTSDVERMLGAVLDGVLAIFNCDRAWLIYPCDPEVTSYRVLIERTQREYLGAYALGAEIPNPEVAGVVRAVLASGGPVRFDPESDHPPPSGPGDRFGVRSMIVMAVYPKRDKPYMFGLHQCSHARIWTRPEERLFQEIGRRLADALDTVLTLRDLRQSERKIERSRAELERLADEQAALRRVATLVAEESAPAELFAKLAEEAANVIGHVDCALLRREDDGAATVIAAWGAGISAGFRVGTQLPVDGGRDGVSSFVLREGRPGRIDDYSAATRTVAEGADEYGIGSAVGCPIVVRGDIWGAILVARFDAEPCPPETESRISKFADLVATAIANADARAEVKRLADEQAALRRVATLVAEGARPSAVLDAVAGEMETLLDADQVALNRFEPGNEMLVLAHRGLDAARTPVGSVVSTEGESATATVRRTGRPARMEGYAGACGPLAELARATGLRSSVSAPITVEGRLWGLITASWKGEQSSPADTEDRMVRFAELLETAIANADGRDQLTASRARLLTEADDARRRVVRDLHDGAQQRLVQAILTLKLAHHALHHKQAEAASLVGEALTQIEQGTGELRELAHGILPGTLTHGGLRPAIRSLARRLHLPVDVDVPPQRFPAAIEASAYFITAEVLTNVVKHSHATRAQVRLTVEDEMLHIDVRDDGIGGADPTGHGLLGISDRVTALGGRLTIDSPPGGGTRVTATLPPSRT